MRRRKTPNQRAANPAAAKATRTRIHMRPRSYPGSPLARPGALGVSFAPRSGMEQMHQFAPEKRVLSSARFSGLAEILG